MEHTTILATNIVTWELASAKHVTGLFPRRLCYVDHWVRSLYEFHS